MPTIDKKTGKFIRTIREWTPDRWNEGHFTNRKRFLVYYPKSSRAYSSGYMLRYYAVWEWFKGEPVPKDKVLHHINENKVDDRIENLQLMTKRDHDDLHRKEQMIGKYLICLVCGKEFYKPNWRLNQKGHVGKYCSKECYCKRKNNR